MSKVEYRVLSEAELTEYLQIRHEALRCAPEAFGMTLEESLRFPDSFHLDFLHNRKILAAFVAGKPVGMMGLNQDRGIKRCHRGSIWGVYVSEGFRGQGIARTLLEKMIAIAKEELKLEVLSLHVVVSNTSAFAMYSDFGFRVVGTEHKAFKDQNGYGDEYLMELLLS